MSKIINNGVKRALRERLLIILNEEEKQFKYWKEIIRHKLHPTRQKQIEREFNKRIQALKIVVHYLTPFMERNTDEPSFLIRQYKKP